MKNIFQAVFQILGFVLLIPIIYAAGVCFYGQVMALPAIKQTALLQGVGIFLLNFLFLYSFKEFFDFTVDSLAKVFSFAGPAATVIGYIVPIYALIVIIIYVILIMLEKAHGLEWIFLSYVGFLLAMHWVVSAKKLYEADTSLLKSSYLLMYSFLLISHLVIGSLILNWVIPEFSSWSFIKNSCILIKSNYLQIYQFLFVDTVGK